MARNTSLLVVPVFLAFAGCVDPSKVVEVVESVANKAEQVGQALVPDTHEALYGAMLDCEERGAEIVEGLSDVQAAREAHPRLRALGKQYRHLARRYLALELPDEAEAKRQIGLFAEREQKLLSRKREFAKRLAEGDKEVTLAVGTASSLVFGPRSVFEMELAGLVMEKTLGQKMPLPPDDSSEADLAAQEKAMIAAARKLNKLADSVEGALREGSIQSRVATIRTQLEDFVGEVDRFVKLPHPKRMKHVIRLDPAREQVDDAIFRYGEVSRVAHAQKNWQEFFRVDFEILQATAKLQAPQVTKDFDQMLEKGQTEMAKQMEQLRSIGSSGTRPGGARPAPPEIPGRPGSGGGFTPGSVGAGGSTIPSAPALEGPDVVTIEIASFPPKMYQQVTQRLTELTSRTNYRASSSGGRYTFSVRWAGELRELARKIDFGTVMKTDDATRTITVEIPPQS